MKLKIVGAAIAVITVSACASQPEEIVTPPPPPSATGPMAGSVGDFQQTAGDTVFFAFDSHALSAQAQETLRRQAEWLQSYSNVQIQVAGNCDERGTTEYNLALGERRATAARDYLVSLGVDPSRVTTISYGKENPRDPRSNEAAWAVNRNAQTVIRSGAAS